MSKRYRAFISYSQLDKKWAKKLQRSLENYQVPAGVLANFDGKKRSIGRIFRDDDDMSASESLGAALEGALDDSESLIAICSPNSAKSSWVEMEVRRFKQAKDAKVFAVIVDGEPNSTQVDEECFCPALRFKVAEDGSLTDHPDEPLAPDWRKDGLLKLTARLVAGVLKVNFDELWNREQRYRRKRNTIMTIVSMVVVGTLLGTGVATIRQINGERAAQLVDLSKVAIKDAMSEALEADRGSNFERALRFSTLAAKSSFLHPKQATAEALLRFAAERSSVQAVLPAHRGKITHAKFNSEGTAVVSAGEDGYLRNWDIGSASLTAEHKTPGSVLSISESNGYAAIIDQQNNEFYVWDIAQQNKHAILTQSDKLPEFAEFSGDGRRLISGGGKGSNIEVWDALAGRKISTLVANSEHEIPLAKLDQGGNTAAIVSQNDTLSVWKVNEAAELFEVSIRVWGDQWLEFSPDKTKLITGRGGDYALYDARNGKYLGLLPGKTRISSDGSQFAAVVEDFKIEVRNAANANLVASLIGHQDKINSLSLSGDGDYVLSASDDGTARLWRAETGQEISRFEGHQGSIVNARFSPNGELVLTQGKDGDIRIYSTTTVTSSSLRHQIRGHDGPLNPPLQFDKSGNRLLTAGRDKTVRIWHADTGKQLLKVAGDTKYGAENIVYDEVKERLILTAVDGSVLIRNARNGDQLRRFLVDQETVDKRMLFSTVFDPNAVRVITPESTGSAKVWDSESGKLLSTLKPDGETFYQIRMSNDGQRAVSLSWEGVTRIWDLNTGHQISKLTGHAGLIESAAISGDGRLVATASQDNTAGIWDANSGKEVATIRGFQEAILRVIFNHDSSLLAVASADGSVRLIETSSFTELESLDGHTDGVNIVQFDDSGTTLLTAGWDNSVRIWDVQTGMEITKITISESSIGAATLSSDASLAAIADTNGAIFVWEIGATNIHQGSSEVNRDSICGQNNKCSTRSSEVSHAC